MEAIAAAAAAKSSSTTITSSNGDPTSPSKIHHYLDAETTLATARRPSALLPSTEIKPTNIYIEPASKVRSHNNIPGTWYLVVRWSFFPRAHIFGSSTLKKKNKRRKITAQKLAKKKTKNNVSFNKRRKYSQDTLGLVRVPGTRTLFFFLFYYQVVSLFSLFFCFERRGHGGDRMRASDPDEIIP